MKDVLDHASVQDDAKKNLKSAQTLNVSPQFYSWQDENNLMAKPTKTKIQRIILDMLMRGGN